jgi:hypothetical protein
VGDRTGARLTDGFVDVWWVCAGVLVLSALTALGMVARTHEPGALRR